MKTVKIDDKYFLKAKLAGKTFNQYHGELEQKNNEGELAVAKVELAKIKELQGAIQSTTELRKADRNLVDSLFRTVKLQDQKIEALTESVAKLTDILTKAITKR